jgi:hypothetical protein
MLTAEMKPIFDGSNTVLIDFGSNGPITSIPKKSNNPMKNAIPPIIRKITPRIERSILAVFDEGFSILNNIRRYIKIYDTKKDLHFKRFVKSIRWLTI